jgi:hypothetical protein
MSLSQNRCTLLRDMLQAKLPLQPDTRIKCGEAGSGSDLKSQRDFPEALSRSELSGLKHIIRAKLLRIFG